MPWQGRTAQTKRPRPTTPAVRRVKLKSKGAKIMKLLNTAKKITTAAALVAALLALALFRAQRFQLATFQHGTACAGGAPSGAFLSRRRRGQILHFTG